MTYDYAEDSVVADELLTEYGQAVTLTRSTVGAYDPATGTAAVTTTTQAAIGAVFDYGLHASGATSILGSLIKIGDRQLLLSTKNAAGGALTAPVIDESTVTIGGVVHTITHVKTLTPSGTAVLYDCNIRR